MNRWTSALAGLLMAMGGGVPASAALHTLTFTGTWRNILSSSVSWTDATPISLSVTWDDTAVSAIPQPDTYDITGPGADYTLTIGTSTWTLADYLPFLTPYPFITFATPGSPEVWYYGVNADKTVAFTGAALLNPSVPTQSFYVTELGGAEGESRGVLTSTVPEPANWALLIAGFGLTGAVMRHRRMALAA